MNEENQGNQPDQSQDQSEQPVQDSGQPTADSTQEQPAQDSGLQTPQPDQPTPPEVERQQTDDSQVAQPQAPQPVSGEPGPSGQAAEGTVSPHPDAQQQASLAVQREQELEEDRRARQDRLGGEGEIRDGEVQAQRQEHNERTGGGDVPQSEPGSSESVNSPDEG